MRAWSRCWASRNCRISDSSAANRSALRRASSLAAASATSCAEGTATAASAPQPAAPTTTATAPATTPPRLRWQGIHLEKGEVDFTDTFIQPLGVSTVDLDGRRGSQAPTWAGNVAVDWTIPLGDSLELFLSGNAAYNDGYITDETSLNDYVQPSFWLLDANVSIGHPDGNWKLSLVGQNLTDKVFVITSGGRPFLSPTGDDIFLTQNRGRQIFAEISFRF